MAHAAQIKIPATYMRGGTSKGVFFSLNAVSYTHLTLPTICSV